MGNLAGVDLGQGNIVTVDTVALLFSASRSLRNIRKTSQLDKVDKEGNDQTVEEVRKQTAYQRDQQIRLDRRTYFSQRACMLAMALGVAPMPNPQTPAAMTAAS